MATWISLALLILAGLVLVFRHETGEIAGLGAGEFASIVAAVALLIFIGTPLLTRYEGGVRGAVKDFIVWAGLTLLLVAGYAYREPLLQVADRVVAELRPAGTALEDPQAGPGERVVRLRRRDDGHFVARTLIGGVSMTMLVDTGASSVVLSAADARRLGIDVDALAYVIPVRTANGTSVAARVRLATIAVGPVGARNVEALVARQGALDESLLGMSFLSQLRSYEFSGDYLTLRG